MYPCLAFFPSLSGEPEGIRLLWTAFSFNAAGLVAFLACFALARKVRSISRLVALCAATFAPLVAGAILIPVASGHHLGLDGVGIVAFSLPLSALTLLLAIGARFVSRDRHSASLAARSTRVALTLGTVLLSGASIVLYLVMIIR